MKHAPCSHSPAENSMGHLGGSNNRCEPEFATGQGLLVEQF